MGMGNVAVSINVSVEMQFICCATKP